MQKSDYYTEEDEIIIENAEELDQLEYTGEDAAPVFNQVRLTRKDFSVFEMYRKYRTGKLILDVNFQRRNVWKSKQQCELIESILMGLPLPIFYLKQEDNAAYIVVDGKQRLSALFQFLNNEFVLRNLKILSFLNGKKYEDLGDNLGIYQTQLEDYQIFSHVILPPTPDKILFDIFDRVNRGGTKLNKQEIRNALYHGKGLDMIGRITKSAAFQKATRIEYLKDARMKGAYLLTRFIAFELMLRGIVYDSDKKQEYNGDADELIVNTLKYLNRSDEKTLSRIEAETTACLEKAELIFGSGAFRKELNSSNPINMNLFETMMYAMILIDEPGEKKERIREKVKDIISSDAFLYCIGDGRDSREKVYRRFSIMRDMAEEINHDR